MSPPWNLGNDIVDLADPRHRGKARDRRFMDRVFTKLEQEAILAAGRPDEALWIRWAGKEAAFKTISKSLGNPPVFVHGTFEVRVFETDAVEPSSGDDEPEVDVPPWRESEGRGDPPLSRFGDVRHGDTLLPLRIELTGRALHAVSWSPQSGGDTPPFSWAFREIAEEDDEWRDRLRPGFSSLEWECISHRASALARLAARQALAETLGVEDHDLEIACGKGRPGQRIPRVLLRGQELPVDLTLSHHGRLLAWAFVPSTGSRARDQSKGR